MISKSVHAWYTNIFASSCPGDLQMYLFSLARLAWSLQNISWKYTSCTECQELTDFKLEMLHREQNAMQNIKKKIVKPATTFYLHNGILGKL